jgi:AraC-like DNA-binding protein
MTRHYGDTPFVTAIHVTFPKPSYSAEYDRILKAPVTFEAEWNAMRIEPSWLALEIHVPNRYVFGIFNAHADDLLKSLETSKTTRGRLESLLIPLLHTGEPDMTDMAQQLGVSRPTLYRRLKAEERQLRGRFGRPALSDGPDLSRRPQAVGQRDRLSGRLLRPQRLLPRLQALDGESSSRERSPLPIFPRKPGPRSEPLRIGKPKGASSPPLAESGPRPSPGKTE